jgi:hypothetical protein
VQAHCGSPETANSLGSWLKSHSSTLVDITHCSIAGVQGNRLKLHHLIGPALRQLHLHNCDLQLGPAGTNHGVLQDCTSLTALELVCCVVQDAPAAAAASAIAALPELQSLKLAHVPGVQGDLVLTLQLSLACQALQPGQVENLRQLSGCVNLRHLQLTDLPSDGVPGGLPSQLVKPTCLDVAYMDVCDGAGQLQHLSSLTALQQLSVASRALVADDLSGLQDLFQLTGLKLAKPR